MCCVPDPQMNTGNFTHILAISLPVLLLGHQNDGPRQEIASLDLGQIHGLITGK